MAWLAFAEVQTDDKERRVSRLQSDHQPLDPDQCDHSLDVVGEDVQRDLCFDVLSRRVKKWDVPIHALMVPNGCSTVPRRIVMGSVGPISLARAASTRCSCAHRVIRRPLPVVHRDFIRHVPHSPVQ